jgi:23S rRNA (uracil1939-C5)-methyltransferase
LEYERQLDVKREILAETLRRSGADFPPEFELAGSPEEGWRTRSSLHFEARGSELRLGLHQEGTHAVVDFERCLQLSPAMMEAALGVRSALRSRPGLWPTLRGLQLAEGNAAGLVATLETRAPSSEAPALAALRGAAPGLTGWAVLAEDHGRETFLLLHGSPWLAHDVAGLRLMSHARAFFQANRFLVEELVAHVLALVPSEGKVLDLYAGVGLFSLPIAKRGQETRAAESDAQAVDDARENARRLGLTGFRIEAADVREALRAWPREEGETVVLDPPRTGAGLDVVEVVAARRPRAILYVSCDPPTLGRDLAHFQRLGYRADRLRAFDMFPDTFHLETVVRLVPGTGG